MTILQNDSRLVFLMPSDAITPSGRFDVIDRSNLGLVGISGIGSIGFTNGTGFNNGLPAMFNTLGNGSGFTDRTGATFIVIPNSGLETEHLNPRIGSGITIGGHITAFGGIFQPKLGSDRSFNGGVLWQFEREYVNSPEKCTLYISSSGVPQDITLRVSNNSTVTEFTVPGALRSNVQTHVMTTVAPNYAIVYVSGIPRTSGTHSADIITPHNLIVGGEGIIHDGYRGCLSGTLVNNISIFNSRLSDLEVLDWAASGIKQSVTPPLPMTPVFTDDPLLVGYWNFTRTDKIFDDTLFDKSHNVGLRGNRVLIIGSSDTVITPFVFQQSGIYNTSITAESKIKGDPVWRSALTVSPSSSFSVFLVGTYGARCYASYGTQAASTRGWDVSGDISPSGKISFRYSRDGIEAFNVLNSASVLTSGEIFSACASFDGALQRVDFYVNGERARSASPVSGISRPNADLQILTRHDTSTSDFTGLGRNNKISQISLFDKALSSGEVRYLNSHGLAPSIAVPSTQFFAFDTDEIADPVGQRHIVFGSFAFLKTLGMGFPNALQFEKATLDLVDQPSVATFTSKPAAFIFRSQNVDRTLFNMRIWNSRHSALITDWDKIEFAASGVWLPKPIIWPSGLNPQVPRQIPAAQNLFRQDGGTALESNDDFNVSQYVYAALIISREHSLGQRGAGLANSDITFSVLYDYF